MSTADVIVIGLGAMGSAAAFQLAKSGQRVIGIDRHAPPHDQGSSHGETRISRQAIGEGAAYVPLVLRSHEIWREIEEETRQSLLLTCGALVLSPRQGAAAHHGKSDFLLQTAASAEAFGIQHELLDAAEVGARYPQLRLRGDEIGYFEPGGGLVFPERCIEAQIALAKRHGAQIRTGERVLEWTSTAHGVRVRTDLDVYEADQLVLAAGAWMPGIAGPALTCLALQRQTLHWFEAEEPEQYQADRFPVFIWIHGSGPEDLFYGFPIVPGSQGVKVARETTRFMSATADGLDRVVAESESQAMFDGHVAGRLKRVRSTCLRAAACIYTVTPDNDFVIDRHPEQPRVLLVSACSGHGFKHSAAIGEAIAQIARGGQTSGLASFGLGRLLGAGGQSQVPQQDRIQ
ncbi:sarcosine oxidase [Arboricoccus pini]|uniref:Sarcosine oxidase n=1 Tax=Arboricoccus pini TaxID=1963835 RepID=A0A212PZX5_9PROT|nr:N-methyl-L-tryptophan oxidase [Arboricoccus pini]SNB52627.1 sarcosine oxidase [Arboricoccus pini]